jgi:predicted dehydrogenase
MTAEKVVRAGLIGCGDISSSHLKTYAACGIEVAGLCDKEIERAEARREEFGTAETPVFDDHRKLLEVPDLDFVTVATPVAAHVPITLDALRAGLHVACEKPSALSIAENEAVVREAEKSDRKVIFFSSRMRWGMMTLAREYAEEGKLGDIYRVDVTYYRRRGRPGLDVIPEAHWFLDSTQAGGGVVMDMGQYFMDAVLDLTGWPQITAASATTFRGHGHELPEEVPFDVEEHCTFLARATGGLSFTFDLAWVAHNHPTRRITILGTEGGILMDGEHPFTFFHDKGGPWRWMNTTTDWKDSVRGNEHAYTDFVRAIRGESVDIGTTPKQALAVTELTQMVLRSAHEGREMTREELRQT